MQRKVHVVAFALLSSLAPATPAAAQQTAPQSDIKIVYETPTNPKLTSIYTRLKQRKVLEELQAFMVPLRLPRDLTVRLAQCGSENIPYRAQVPATVCYELIDKIEQVAVSHTNDPDLQQTVIIGGFVQAMLRETAHALFDVLDVPIWGREDDAADRLAAIVMMQFGDDVANVVMFGTQLLFRWSNQKWTGNDFASEVSPDYQRYFNYACVAVAANWPQFSGLVLKGVMPASRAEQCESEYAQIRKAFNLRIMPHIDANLLIKIRAAPWLSWANQQ
jgi:Putative metallopeptidase